MPKRKLITYLNKKYPISEGLKILLENEGTLDLTSSKKGTSLLIPRMNVHEVHYLISGMCKAFWLNEDNEEEIFQIWTADSLILLLEVFFAGHKNTTVHIVMLEDSELITITKVQLDEMEMVYPEMKKVMERIRAEILELRNLQLRILMKKEGERYALFYDMFPELRARLTNKDIGAFLGICQSTLGNCKKSRLLKDRSKKKSR
ncbi:Crp/Fnr family transcriptional regulator [Pedobacter heparinus]|uniref:Cyclic nucleotide-binding n=1 Tax=Pedobacter heparinus (strain ATCC 13125 / DSM 2366 / CIP 104194 / JCM 7457 / NBRC 12017 / NCIMB 9290 / NRRL B-14731 / HIM 762-3) TaxID=485917 RepID=C6XVH1_PEDHD|nr:Crp/Fnr family transcriptional regulator [Pedobacter heparinus]ACU04037.1 cyclic nucleotide-binding [Pedobacter heparinus DSM 2366]